MIDIPLTEKQLDTLLYGGEVVLTVGDITYAIVENNELDEIDIDCRNPNELGQHPLPISGGELQDIKEEGTIFDDWIICGNNVRVFKGA